MLVTPCAAERELLEMARDRNLYGWFRTDVGWSFGPRQHNIYTGPFKSTALVRRLEASGKLSVVAYPTCSSLHPSFKALARADLTKRGRQCL